jgi:hypothetical protein
MSFQRRAFAPARPSRGESVLAVGRRVYVSCPESGPGHVTLTDEVGVPSLVRLADGSEVEIRAWQPRGPRGTRYRVRTTGADGHEGWLAAGDLRSSLTRVPPAPPLPAEAPTPPTSVLPPGAARSRFGRRTE